ncbi:restriction endonuclease subunit S [Mesomycoplasma hyorhinis]|uniref:restriction endonuclease subunit S n=3 Tax=Mesomycoplasma hyorhinis TaxID=2100 RepID=UPI000243A61B|nr:restriction endonuclease subunit S [Mesomycoplasma hyorhinis]AEX14157.1 Type I site-specific DNA methyltransferase specificity subunit [Mesomycoplasma hyorhinis GDL-1]AHA41155.1 type I restriction modification DNA specificity subunit S protein [Mesomycoplasma hyorhinis DBS 1050]
MKKVLKPEIRFKGFTDAWIQCKVGELFELDGGGFVSKYEIQNNPGKYPVYSSQTTNNGTMGYISSYKYDLECLTWTTRGYAGVVFYRNEKFSVSNSGLLIFKRNIIYNYRYFLFVFQMADIQKSMTAGNIPQFTVEMMKEAVLTYSNNLNEQRKISQLFYTLDKIISLYERKMSLLEKLQKALFSNIFVLNANNKPLIRFKSFFEFWEKNNISDLCKINRGNSKYTINYIQQNVGKFPVYSSQTQNEGISGNISTYDYDGEYITWTMDGVNAGTVFYRNGKFNVSSSGVLAPNSNKNINTKFLFYVLKLMNLNQENIGETIPHFTGSMMNKLEITFVKNKQEQNKIADLFSNIDSTHAQLKRKLNLIKNIQKSVLNKMFV